jgi:mRNA interferase RelE/StbE
LIYKIEFKKSAAKALKGMQKSEKKRIAQKIEELAENLPNPAITKMKGNNPFHKVRLGDYRIIYEIHEKAIVIFYDNNLWVFLT